MSIEPSAMRFDIYEYVGVILPGSVVVLAVSLFSPEVKELLGKDGVSIGGLGVFVIASFVVGHVVQALGNAIEWIGDSMFGQGRSNLMLLPEQSLIANSQRQRLKVALATDTGADLDRLSEAEWRSIRREMFAKVKAAGATERIDTFNRTYGLLRGLAAGFLLAAGFTAAASPERWVLAAALALASALALYRMRRFSDHYARELVIEYLRVLAVPKTATSSPGQSLADRTNSTAS